MDLKVIWWLNVESNVKYQFCQPKNTRTELLQAVISIHFRKYEFYLVRKAAILKKMRLKKFLEHARPASGEFVIYACY